MKKFAAVVIVECETLDQAQIVLAERLAYDENYGYRYAIIHTELAEV